jgi:hypothetical protein
MTGMMLIWLHETVLSLGWTLTIPDTMIPSHERLDFVTSRFLVDMISKAFCRRLKGPEHSQATAHSSYVEFLDRELDRAIGQKQC